MLGNMQNQNNLCGISGSDKSTTLTELAKHLEITCTHCRPISPMTCLSGCKTWKIKNQFRKLYEKTKDSDVITRISTTLKNKKRHQLLELISGESLPLSEIQRRFRDGHFVLSQQSLMEDYLDPLIAAGLAEEAQNSYQATIFGIRITELLKNLEDIEDILPSDPYWYEGKVLDLLMQRPQTFTDLEKMIPADVAANVLGRFTKMHFVDKSDERDHVFFFVTKRSPSLSCLSSLERNIYREIPLEGASAQRLSTLARVSIRQMYKGIRKLKGKKLVFTRRKSITYSLTAKGLQVVMTLEAIRRLAQEANLATSMLFANENGQGFLGEVSVPKNMTHQKSRLVR